MRLHRFYINQAVGIQKELVVESSDLVHQIRTVFRLKTGDDVVVFDGSGSDFQCRIADFGKSSITLDVELATKSRYMPSREVILYASIVKKDNFEWIVEKATELGVTRIIPVISERSEKKALNMERLKKIAVEASEQSGRGNIPEIGEIKTLADSVQAITDKQYGIKNKVAFHIDGANLSRSDLAEDSVALFIGPEGGWSIDEIDLFNKNNIKVVSLGGQVLRAETAVIAALSLVLLDA